MIPPCLRTPPWTRIPTRMSHVTLLRWGHNLTHCFFLPPAPQNTKIFAFGFAATAHRRGIPDDHGGVLHPCRESHGRGRGSGEGLRDRQHRLQAGAEKPHGLTGNVHPECKRSASPARYPPSPDGASREYLQPIWINDVCFSFAASALMELCQTAVALFSKWIIPSDSLLVNFKSQGPFSRLDSSSPRHIVMQGSKGPILCKILHFANVFFLCLWPGYEVHLLSLC